jgi:hypothetical protein
VGAKRDGCEHEVFFRAAIFSDSSHEGDVHVAAKLEGQRIGTLSLYRLIKPIIDHFVQDRSLNDEARTARIKDAIFRISSQPEDAALRTFESQFPNLPRQEAIVDLADALDAVKNDLWGNLYGYMSKCCQFLPPDHISLAKWWRMGPEASDLDPTLRIEDTALMRNIGN